MAWGFPVRATAWIGWWCHSRRQHTEAPLPKSNLHLFLSVSVCFSLMKIFSLPVGRLKVLLCSLLYDLKRREFLWIVFPSYAGFLFLNQTAQHPRTVSVLA